MTRNPWLIGQPSGEPARHPVFCFPNAGGGASLFARWARESPETLEILGVQLPGRENRLNEPPVTNFSRLLEAIWQAIGPLLDRPYVLLGHSMGALVAFEFARTVRRAAAPPPEVLWVLSLGPPDTVRSSSNLHRLPDEQLLAAVQNRFGGIPDVIRDDPEMLRLILPSLRADMTLLEQYKYEEGPPLDCPIVACGGRDDPIVSEETLAGWQRHTTSPFELRMFSGGHFFLKEQAAAILAGIELSLSLEPDA